jgi:hypothetical protein
LPPTVQVVRGRNSDEGRLRRTARRDAGDDRQPMRSHVIEDHLPFIGSHCGGALSRKRRPKAAALSYELTRCLRWRPAAYEQDSVS